MEEHRLTLRKVLQVMDSSQFMSKMIKYINDNLSDAVQNDSPPPVVTEKDVQKQDDVSRDEDQMMHSVRDDSKNLVSKRQRVSQGRDSDAFCKMRPSSSVSSHERSSTGNSYQRKLSKRPAGFQFHEKVTPPSMRVSTEANVEMMSPSTMLLSPKFSPEYRKFWSMKPDLLTPGLNPLHPLALFPGCYLPHPVFSRFSGDV